MKTKRLILYILASILMLTLVTGCTAHIDSSNKSIADVGSLQFGNCSFLVPKSYFENAKDFVPMTTTHYDTIEDKDAAKTIIATGAIKGQTETGFMLSSPEYFFYVAKAKGTVDVLDCSRADVLNLVQRSDIEFINYGRYIANADILPRANMRVDFKVKLSNGTQRAYAGYISIVTKGSECYYYIASYAYSSISEEQLKYCFDLVRSLK